MRPNTPLLTLLDRHASMLAEGAVIERLRRETSLDLDPYLLNTGLIYSRSGRSAMARIYYQYLEIAAEFRLPIMLAAPTWRANAERVRKAGLDDADRVNKDAVRFMHELCLDQSPLEGPPVVVGGLMACRGDAYNPTDALDADSAEAFHGSQARSLADAGVDYIMAATLPALPEALGLARSLAQLPVPYMLSFIIRKDGNLLDGTPLADAVRQIDGRVSPKPVGYLLNCVHPQTVIDGLNKTRSTDGVLKGRLLGIQANTSTKSPETLDGSECLDGAEPEGFADTVVGLRNRLGMRIFGGCCGTDHRHIRAIAVRLASAGRTKGGQPVKNAGD